MNTTGTAIYLLLERKKITWSRRDASTYLLGMNPSYLAQRGDRELSERALINLFQFLWRERRYSLALGVAHELLFRRPTGSSQ